MCLCHITQSCLSKIGRRISSNCKNSGPAPAAHRHWPSTSLTTFSFLPGSCQTASFKFVGCFRIISIEIRSTGAVLIPCNSHKKRLLSERLRDVWSPLTRPRYSRIRRDIGSFLRQKLVRFVIQMPIHNPDAASPLFGKCVDSFSDGTNPLRIPA